MGNTCACKTRERPTGDADSRIKTNHSTETSGGGTSDHEINFNLKDEQPRGELSPETVGSDSFIIKSAEQNPIPFRTDLNGAKERSATRPSSLSTNVVPTAIPNVPTLNPRVPTLVESVVPTKDVSEANKKSVDILTHPIEVGKTEKNFHTELTCCSVDDNGSSKNLSVANFSSTCCDSIEHPDLEVPLVEESVPVIILDEIDESHKVVPIPDAQASDVPIMDEPTQSGSNNSGGRKRRRASEDGGKKTTKKRRPQGGRNTTWMNGLASSSQTSGSVCKGGDGTVQKFSISISKTTAMGGQKQAPVILGQGSVPVGNAKYRRRQRRQQEAERRKLNHSEMSQNSEVSTPGRQTSDFAFRDPLTFCAATVSTTHQPEGCLTPAQILICPKMTSPIRPILVSDSTYGEHNLNLTSSEHFRSPPETTPIE